MSEKIINNFSGGIAEDIREPRTNTFSNCEGFDTTSKDHKLIPYGEQEAEALTSGDITDRRISDVIVANAGLLIAVGRNGSATPTTFDLFDKDSSTDISTTWASYTSLAGAGGYRANSLIYYNNALYVYDTAFNVRKHDGSWSNVGAVDVTSTWDAMLVPRPFIHPMDDVLYLAGVNALAKIDDTTYSDITSVSTPEDLYISSLTDFGAYLAIAATPAFSGVSRVYLWNRDTSQTTFTENINWGEGSLLILENIGGVLVGVSISDNSYANYSTYTTVKSKKLVIKAYTGGEPVVIKELDVASNFVLRNFKSQVNGRLYFGGDNDDALYVVYKDRTGRIIVSRDRFVYNGATITTLRGLSVIGDYLFTMFDTAGSSGLFYRTKVTPSYTATSTYESLINHSMDLDDRTKKKKLHFISIAKASTTGQLVVSVSVDGGAYQTVATLAASTSLVKKESRLATGTPFTDGYEFKFKVESTSGAEFTELKYAYEVIEKNI